MLWAKSPTEETFCSLFPMTPWYQGHTTMEENMALGSFISCKAIFVHAGAVVNYKCNESGFVCFFVERKKHELDRKRGGYLRRLGEGNGI